MKTSAISLLICLQSFFGSQTSLAEDVAIDCRDINGVTLFLKITDEKMTLLTDDRHFVHMAITNMRLPLAYYRATSAEIVMNKSWCSFNRNDRAIAGCMRNLFDPSRWSSVLTFRDENNAIVGNPLDVNSSFSSEFQDVVQIGNALKRYSVNLSVSFSVGELSHSYEHVFDFTIFEARAAGCTGRYDLGAATN